MPAKKKTYEDKQLEDAIASGNMAVIEPEDTRTTSGVAAETGPARSTADLDPTWVCDFDGARLNVQRQATFDDKPHEVRICSANPHHTKIVQV